MSEERFYAVRMLWIRDPVKFDEYQELAKPVLARHGVHIERWLVTQDIEGDGLERPDLIVVTWFASPEAKTAFENDPEYLRAAQVRDAAVRLVTITGWSATTGGKDG